LSKLEIQNYRSSGELHKCDTIKKGRLLRKPKVLGLHIESASFSIDKKGIIEFLESIKRGCRTL